MITRRVEYTCSILTIPLLFLAPGSLLAASTLDGGLLADLLEADLGQNTIDSSWGHDQEPTDKDIRLKVMTFNTWQSGKNVVNGLNKVIKTIKLVDPDIVGLQEVQTHHELDYFLQELGEPWQGVWHSSPWYPDTGVLSKFPLDQNATMEVTWGMGVPVLIDPELNITLYFFNFHLNVRSFQLYAAQNKLVTSPEQLLAGERSRDGQGRLQNIEELLSQRIFQSMLENADQSPVMLVGDLNTPSHLDWIKEMSSDHGGWVFEWPVTKAIADHGLMDSYRELYPNVTESPGCSWSTIQNATGTEWEYSIPEPQDRIDYIYYKGARLVPKRSYLYPNSNATMNEGDDGSPLRKIPLHVHNDYPSDHYALVTEFELKL